MDFIRRHISDVIEKADGSFKGVLLTGARQTGKSTLLRALFPEKRYVAVDDPFIEEQANGNPNEFMMLNPPPVIYDEVQRAPGLFRFIKIKCDESEDRGLFCLSGSQPLELMKNASESLSGRVCVLELNGLSLREIQKCRFTDPFVPTLEYVSKRAGTVLPVENIWTHIHRGGFPELQDPGVDWSLFFSGYVKTYLERDVRGLAAVQDLNDFRRFMVAVAARTGQMLNYSNIADEIGRDAATVKRWTSILEATGIIFILEPFSSSVLKRAVKTPKVYFRDTGLASYLTRWLTPEALAYGAMSGQMFETYVITEIIKSYSNRGLDYRYFVSYYRGKDKKKIKTGGGEIAVESEIDFIIEENGILYPIEIKQASKVSAEMTGAFTVLDKIADKKRGTGAVVCMCPQPGVLRENVIAVPAWYL